MLNIIPDLEQFSLGEPGGPVSLKLQGKSGKPAKAMPKLPAMKKTAHRVSTSAPVKAASANPYNYGPSGPAFSGGPSGPMFTGGPSGPAFMGGPSGPMI